MGLMILKPRREAGFFVALDEYVKYLPRVVPTKRAHGRAKRKSEGRSFETRKILHK